VNTTTPTTLHSRSIISTDESFFVVAVKAAVVKVVVLKVALVIVSTTQVAAKVVIVTASGRLTKLVNSLSNHETPTAVLFTAIQSTATFLTNSSTALSKAMLNLLWQLSTSGRRSI
jgi:hypothetical protein